MAPPACYPTSPLVPQPGLSAARSGGDASDSPHPRARPPAVAGSAARAGRWLLPWMGALIVSGGLAHAMEQALVRALPAPPVPSARVLYAGDPIAAMPAAGCAARDGGTQYIGLNTWIPADPQAKPCLPPSADPGSRWVGIEAVALDGPARRLTCLTRADRVSTDVLAVGAEDLDTVMADLCAEVRQ